MYTKKQKVACARKEKNAAESQRVLLSKITETAQLTGSLYATDKRQYTII